MTPTPENPLHAMGLDPGTKRNLLRRLARVRGQIEGIQRMVEAERYCPEILQQSSAVHSAIRAVERLLLRNHLDRCTTHALQMGGSAASQVTEEIVDLLSRYVR